MAFYWLVLTLVYETTTASEPEANLHESQKVDLLRHSP